MKQAGIRFNRGYAKCVLGGLGASTLCVILGAMLLTTLVISGSIDVKKMGIGVTMVIFLSALLGALCVKVTKGKGSRGAILILLCCIVATVFLVNILAFGGEFSGVPLKIGATIAGTLIMLLKNNDKQKKYRKAKNR